MLHFEIAECPVCEKIKHVRNNVEEDLATVMSGLLYNHG